MARKKRRKLYGAALTAWRKAHRKNPKRRRKSRKNAHCATRVNAPWANPKRKRRSYRKARRSYSRRRRSNPFRMPAIPSFKGAFGDAQKGIIGALAISGAVVAVIWGTRQLEQRVPAVSSGIPNLLMKLAVATAASMVAARVLKGQDRLKTVASAAVFLPLLGEGAMRFAPQFAGFVPSIGGGSAMAPARLGMTPGDRLSDYTLDAELDAGLESDSERSMY